VDSVALTAVCSPEVEAASIFSDPLARIFNDAEHSGREIREIIIGRSARGRLLLASAPGKQPSWSSTTMKKTSPDKPEKKGTEAMKAEYRFDYSVAKPNRFAGQIRKGSVAVLLDPDVAKLFKDAESVNAVLRALMATMPARRVPPR